MSDGQLLLIDKPSGITSFDVIRALRKKLSIRKMGHAGTLDPLATGLLIVATGSKTKELKYILGADKTYIANIAFGIKTTTGDADGEVIVVDENVCINEINLHDEVNKIIGSRILEVSKYSAVKQGGKPLYQRVRQGQKVIIPKREMVVLQAKVLAYDIEKNTAQVFFEVASGTYIRSLAEEIAKQLGTYGHLTALRRTSIGEYDVKDAKKLEEL